MCLIAWHWQPASATPLLLLSNRDEFYGRPALPVHWWSKAGLLAGRDLQAGGTWLGVEGTGRLAALTNYRSPLPPRLDAPSRGNLVTGFLESRLDAGAYLAQLLQHVAAYNPFNLLVFDGNRLMGLESRTAKIVEMQPGVGGVSNADFHTPWPKLSRLSAQLQHSVDLGATEDADLLPLLQDPVLAPDPALPSTGVPLDLERSLSAIFISGPAYGTRACSVVRLGKNGGRFTERTFDATGRLGHRTFNF